MAAATGVFHRSYGSELRLRHTRVEHVRLALALVGLVALPFFASPFWLTVANQVGIAVVGAVGLNILTGYTGQISLGQGGFLAVGAYTSGLLVARAGVPTLAAVVIAVLFTALVGALFGLPALRLKGLYLAIATLAAQFIILWVVRNWSAVTGGVDSLFVDDPVLFGFSFGTDFRWYWLIGGAAVLAVITEPVSHGRGPGVHGDPRPGHRRRGHRRQPHPLQGRGVRGVVRLRRAGGCADGPLDEHRHVRAFHTQRVSTSR